MLHLNGESAKARTRQREIETLSPILLKSASKVRSIQKEGRTPSSSSSLERVCLQNGIKSEWIQKLVGGKSLEE
jgi:hypothetical protein